MANTSNLDDQPGTSSGVPSITRGSPKDTVTSTGTPAEPSANVEGSTSGEPEINADGPSKYHTGYGGEGSSPAPRSGGKIPASGVSDDASGNHRHTGYIRGEK